MEKQKTQDLGKDAAIAANSFEAAGIDDGQKYKERIPVILVMHGLHPGIMLTAGKTGNQLITAEWFDILERWQHNISKEFWKDYCDYPDSRVSGIIAPYDFIVDRGEGTDWTNQKLERARSGLNRKDYGIMTLEASMTPTNHPARGVAWKKRNWTQKATKQVPGNRKVRPIQYTPNATSYAPIDKPTTFAIVGGGI